jgi:RNA polymerase sigma-70 factor (ECF subfamily)
VNDPAYDRAWAETLVGLVRARLREELDGRHGALDFAALEEFLGEEPNETYAAAARRLGVTEGALKSAIYRLRLRQAAVMREEIAATVSSPDEVDAELRYLVEVLSR